MNLERSNTFQEQLHLLGESIDFDRNVRPTTYKEMCNTYQKVSPLQLSSFVGEGIDHIKEMGTSKGEVVDILQPIQVRVCDDSN